MHLRRALVAAAVLLVLTGCRSSSSEVAPADVAATTSGGLTLHQAKQGFAWNATVQAPGLATVRGKTLLHFGQDVCNDLGAGDWPKKSVPAYTRHYGMNPRQMTAVIHAAVGFLCPEFRQLVEPS